MVHLADVKVDSNIYPRDQWKTDTIKNYVDALRGGAQFPPIVLEEGTNRLLDGLHRLKAYQLYLEQYQEYQTQSELEGMESEEWAPPADDIEVKYRVIPDGVPAKLFAASFSTNHGDRITVADRKAIAREVFETHPDFKLRELAQYLDISKSRAGDFTADIRARRKEQQKMTAYRLHRLGWTQEEIAEVVGITRDSYTSSFLCGFPDLEKDTKNLLAEGHPHLDVAERYNMPLILAWAIDLAGRTDAQRMERLGINVQPYDAWSFSKCSDLFGAKYPGRIPGQLIAHVLYFFTEPGDVVIDPMAGSGTISDVCLAMGRKHYGYDLDNRYQRADIIRHNLAVDGWPDRIKKADLIFWDPPYFAKMDKLNIGDDGYIEGSISSLSRTEYLSFFADRLSEARQLVKAGTRVAFLMSDWIDESDGDESIFIWHYADLLREAGWNLTRHIQVPLSTQQVRASVVKNYRESKKQAYLERYLIIGSAGHE